MDREKRILSIDLGSQDIAIVNNVCEKDLLEGDGFLFLTGPFTKSNLPVGGRFNILARDVHSKKIVQSNSGGAWGRRLAYAGFDGLFIKGKSPEPVRLVIDGRQEEAKVEFLRGDSLWGLGSREVHKRLQDLYGPDSSSIYIGPGGERGLLLACLIQDVDRASGRKSFGAILGQKNLKAISLLSKESLHLDKESMKKRLEENAGGQEDLLLPIIESLGAPFSEEIFQERRARALEENLNPSCYSCPILCNKGRMEKKDPKDHKYFWKFSPQDREVYNKKANALADDLGLDTLGLVNYLEDAMKEERGLTWQDPQGILDFIQNAVDDPKLGCRINDFIRETAQDRGLKKGLKTTSEAMKKKDSFFEILDLLGLCIFAGRRLEEEYLRALTNAVTGEKLTREEFLALKVLD